MPEAPPSTALALATEVPDEDTESGLVLPPGKDPLVNALIALETGQVRRDSLAARRYQALMDRLIRVEQNSVVAAQQLARIAEAESDEAKANAKKTDADLEAASWWRHQWEKCSADPKFMAGMAGLASSIVTTGLGILSAVAYHYFGGHP